MIVERKGIENRYTSVDNTVIVAKIAAEKANNDVVVSTAVHRILASRVKCRPIIGEKFWKVETIVDRDKHNEFINNFSKKNF